MTTIGPAHDFFRLLEALSPITSSDMTRPHLNYARITPMKPGGALEGLATDGHAAVRIVTSNIFEGVAGAMWVGCFGRSLDLSRCTRAEIRGDDLVLSRSVPGGRIERVYAAPDPRDVEYFPADAFPKIIPKRDSARDVARGVGLNPDLIAQVVRSVAKVATSIRWQAPADPLSPIRIEDDVLREGFASVEYAVMPFRLQERARP